MQEDDKRSAKPFVSQKRFQGIKTDLLQYFQDNSNVDKTVQDILDIICNNIKYDPKATTYTIKKGEWVANYRREKAKELGISLYELTGQKDKYHKNKLK